MPHRNEKEALLNKVGLYGFGGFAAAAILSAMLYAFFGVSFWSSTEEPFRVILLVIFHIVGFASILPAIHFLEQVYEDNRRAREQV